MSELRTTQEDGTADKICKIALTGGPSGGKSTVLWRVADQMPDAYCVPEVATLLLSGGFPAPTETHPWDYEWQRSFQRTVAVTQLALEQVCKQRARREDKKLIIYDRGLLDGAAYLRGGPAELTILTDMSEDDMLSQYDHILHLPSSATKQAYDKSSNPHRFEEVEEALRLEERVTQAWRNHPSRTILDFPTTEENIQTAVTYIKDLEEKL